LLPRKGAPPPFNSPEIEVKRKAVNAWIRSSGAFDAVVDFERVVADPSDPDRMRSEFDSGDHRHPNDARLRSDGRRVESELVRRKPIARASWSARASIG
jgi:hypothetical protein